MVNGNLWSRRAKSALWSLLDNFSHTLKAGRYPAHPGFVRLFWPFLSQPVLGGLSARLDSSATMNCDFVSMNSKTEYYDSAKILSKWGFTDSQCHNCGISNSDINGLLMQCAKCKRAYYCSMKVCIFLVAAGGLGSTPRFLLTFLSFPVLQ
jgi:hypothetical protein